MIKDSSYGIIPLRIHQDEWQVLIIQHQAGHWAFPKGHADSNEFPKQTAERELCEETGLIVQRYLFSEPLLENYYFTSKGQDIAKTVHYFLALVKGEVNIQEAEIQASQWLNLKEAYHQITFKEGKQICLKVIEILQKS